MATQNGTAHPSAPQDVTPLELLDELLATAGNVVAGGLSRHPRLLEALDRQDELRALVTETEMVEKMSPEDRWGHAVLLGPNGMVVGIGDTKADAWADACHTAEEGRIELVEEDCQFVVYDSEVVELRNEGGLMVLAEAERGE